jgi:hypothetical protein
MLAGKLHQPVALEVLNEPFCAPATGPGGWPALQERLVRQIQRVAPKLPLILTGCRGRPDTLLKMDASPYAGNPNLYWTFHYYDFFGSQEIASLESVPFPPRPELASSITQLLTMVPASTLAKNPRIVGQLRDYLLNHHGQGTIRADMEKIAAWARSQRIPAGHVLLGEFAPLLTDRRENESVRSDQLRWIAAVRGEAERQGFLWAYWVAPEPPQLNYDPATRFFRPDALRAFGLSSGLG